MTSLVTIVGAAISAFLGAWLASHFNLRRFYREKTWERRAETYTAIFNSLHDIERFFDQQITLAATGRQISDNERDRLTDEFVESARNMVRRAAAETWLISDAFSSRLDRDDDLHLDKPWEQFLFLNHREAKETIADLRRIARKDLSITT